MYPANNTNRPEESLSIRDSKMKMPEVGDAVTLSKVITDEDIREFARISGDYNPIHMDEKFAAKTRFKKRIAHGMLTTSLLSNLAGNRLPGPGSIYLSQTMKFKNPTYIGDTVTAEIKVLNVRKDKPIVTLSTICRNQHGEVLVSGEALIYYEPIWTPS